MDDSNERRLDRGACFAARFTWLSRDEHFDQVTGLRRMGRCLISSLDAVHRIAISHVSPNYVGKIR